MHKLASYSSLTLAHLHAAHLRTQGIMAGVLGDHLVGVEPALRFFRPEFFDLYIATSRHEAHAKELIEAFGAPELPDDWEADAIPDLTRLDPSRLPDCPHCRAPLDPLKPFGPCAACNTPVDITELIINTLGPDALVDCYTHLSPSSELSDDEILSVPLDCDHCKHPLDQTPTISGHCPNCAQPFDRRETVSLLLNDQP